MIVVQKKIDYLVRLHISTVRVEESIIASGTFLLIISLLILCRNHINHLMWALFLIKGLTHIVSKLNYITGYFTSAYRRSMTKLFAIMAIKSL